jgi:hypothetical protein
MYQSAVIIKLSQKSGFLIQFITLVPVLVLFLFSLSIASSENSSSQLIIYRLKEGNVKDIRHHFSTDEKIYAKFTLLPEKRETGIEFRWINPLMTKNQTYFYLVNSQEPHEKISVLCWLYLPSSLSEKFIGSKYHGRWILEVWVNNHRAATKVFDVGN